MAHPYHAHREHHVERERVHHITGHHEGHRDHEHVYHRARGGRAEHSHEDVSEDKAIVRGMVKPAALKSHGGKTKAHPGKVQRAKGGRVKKHKGTIVNVNVAPQQSAPHPMPIPVPGGTPGAAAGPPPMPPRPPMPAPGGPVPGPIMGPRASGGRVAGFATGGPVEHPKHGGMAPHLPSGSGGARARLAKEKMAARHYHKTPPARHTP